MHLSYDLKEENLRMKDESTEDKLNDERDITEQVTAFIDKLQLQSDEMQREKEQVTKISAKFCCYLSRNSITPYNDIIHNHLDMLIRNEEGKEVKDIKRINRIQNLEATYNKMKEDIDAAMNQQDPCDADIISKPEEVIELSKELFGLKFSGQFLKQVNDLIRKMASTHPSYEPTSFSIINTRSQLKDRFLRPNSTLGTHLASESEDCSNFTYDLT